MTRPRIVIIGGGFAGYYAARSLCSTVRAEAEVVILNPTDYFLYLPLLPEVAAGVLDPRRVTVSIPGTAPRVDLVLGSASGVNMDEHRVSYLDADGRRASLAYDRLLITTGSVNKLLPIPGVAEHARGFRSIAEALYLRDHMIRQIELADSADDPAERDARLTFVVVGAGYTGTEVAAQGVLMTAGLAGKHPRLAAASRGGCWSIRPAACCPVSARTWPRPPPGCCAAAASRCAPVCQWPRRWPRASGSATAAASAPDH